MKIHNVELRNVRRIKALRLDLSAPLTVIAGPNGVGKTTLQQAILASMFWQKKDDRDSFVSQFDPDSTPTVILGFSGGGPAATITLERHLADDKGEWREEALVFKKKGQALEKIQEVLPISADAAALLLWGRQDDLSAVVESFPSDGHSLLTAATIKGSGPDPKEIIDALKKDIDQAEKGARGGQVIGALTQALKQVNALTREYAEADHIDRELRSCREQLANAKKLRDETNVKLASAKASIEKLTSLEQLLDAALKDIETRDQMVETLTQWESLDGEIDIANNSLTELQGELVQLSCQHRYVRDLELTGQIQALEKHIAAVVELTTAVADLARDLKSKKRPDPTDVELLEDLQTRIKQANDRMEATGVSYEVSAQKSPRMFHIAEDGQPAEQITLSAGQSKSGIVGSVVIEGDGLRFSAGGKEDIAKHKKAIAADTEEMQGLFGKFEVESETGFCKLAQERKQLNEALGQKKTDLRVQLGTLTLDALQTELSRSLAARTQNNMTLADKEACAGRLLASSTELDKARSAKSAEIHNERQHLAMLEAKRPSDAAKKLHLSNLETIRKKARESSAAFTAADELGREPTKFLQAEIQRALAAQRADQTRETSMLLEAEKHVATLAGRLQAAQPHRPLDVIQDALNEAKEAVHREEVRQEARSLLKQRIEEKMAQLAAHVPVELGKRITDHLTRLTGGSANRVVLSQDLAVTTVGEDGSPLAWKPSQLSHGERHQTALAVKIAVARALAETSGPVFIILDDSLVSFDPDRRAATEDFLLELAHEEKIQVILLTCHSDWATDWKQRQPAKVHCIDLAQAATYYGTRRTKA